jgi:hypothetical protein
LLIKKKNNNNSSSNYNYNNTKVTQAYKARLQRRIIANPERYVKPNKLRKLTPEERYQMLKEQWYFHDSSYEMRGANGYDGQGCNQHGCISTCKYFAKEGREPEEEEQVLATTSTNLLHREEEDPTTVTTTVKGKAKTKAVIVISKRKKLKRKKKKKVIRI